MKHVIAWAFLASVVSCSGSGTETDNPASPLEDFSASTCKTKQESPGQQALIAQSEADGLTCVEWQRGAGGALDLTLYNISEPCSYDEHFGKAELASDGTLVASVYKSTCNVAKCGLCLFDYHFQLQGMSADAPLPLRFGTAVCESQPTMYEDELTLPVDTEESGIICRALESGAVAEFARSKSSCGSVNMPCGPTCDGPGRTSCDAGLTCTELASNDARCLSDCESDEDCPAGLTSCVAGVCQAAKSW